MQTKAHSFFEACTNVLSGIILALVSYQLIMPHMGYDIQFEDNLIITAYFTVMGMVRSYIIRRAYNAALRRSMH